MVVTRKNLGIEVSGRTLLVEDASFNVSAASSPRRVIGASPSWGHDGPLQTEISLRGVFSENWSWLLNAATGENSGGFPLRMGNVILQNCYLTEFEVRGESHGTIAVTANLRSWAAHSGAFSGTYTGLGTGVEHAYHSQYSDFSAQTGIYAPEAFVYRVQSERLPRFTVGSSTPSVVRLARLEKELTLNGKNVTSFVSYSGGSGVAQFSLNYATGSLNTGFNVYVSGEISTQDFSLGDLLGVGITIKEFIR